MEGLLCYGEVDKIVQCCGFLLFDMKCYVVVLGYKSGGFCVEFSDLDVFEYLVLVFIYYVGFKYFVVVCDVYNDYVFVVDLVLGNISFIWMCFEEIWDQNVLFVIFLSGQEFCNVLVLNDCDMCLVDDCIVSLLVFCEFLQINKIIENQVCELGIGGDVIYLCIKQQIFKNKNNFWGQCYENQGVYMCGGVDVVYQWFVCC